MAFERPLRIFFGWFIRVGGDADGYATTSAGMDLLYPWFLTGKIVSSDLRVHNRRPILPADGDIQEWDEYLDLKYASCEIAKAGEIYKFRDTMGVEDVLVWQPNSNFAYLPGNALTLETELSEFLFPTKRLTFPDPTTVTTPSLRWVADPDEIVSGTVESKHEIWIKTTVAAVDSSSTSIRVNKYTGSNELRFWIKDAYGASIDVTMARANLEEHGITGELIWSDFPKEVTGLIGYNLSTGVDPQITVTSKGDGWYEVIIADFFSRSYSSGTVMDLPVYNNAIHRVAFDYERRHRINTSAEYSSTQLWLVLDAETNKYYKCLVEAISPVFLMGVGKRTENSAQLVLRIMEEGIFMPDAWTDPNDSAHFIAWVR